MTGPGDPLQVALLTAVVFALSTLFSMLGLGGGQLYVPLLYWLGYDLQRQAIPAALLLNFLTQASAAVSYLRARLVEVRTALPLLVSLSVFPWFGARLTAHFSDRFLLAVFSVLLLVVALLTALPWRPRRREMKPATRTGLGLGVGAAVGLVVGLLGRGGGSFVVPLLLVMGLDARRAAATSAFTLSISVFIGFLGHLSEAKLGISLLPLALAALVGSQLGARLVVTRIRAEVLKPIFAAVLAVIGLVMLWGLW